MTNEYTQPLKYDLLSVYLSILVDIKEMPSKIQDILIAQKKQKPADFILTILMRLSRI